MSDLTPEQTAALALVAARTKDATLKEIAEFMLPGFVNSMQRYVGLAYGKVSLPFDSEVDGVLNEHQRLLLKALNGVRTEAARLGLHIGETVILENGRQRILFPGVRADLTTQQAYRIDNNDLYQPGRLSLLPIIIFPAVFAENGGIIQPGLVRGGYINYTRLEEYAEGGNSDFTSWTAPRPAQFPSEE